MQADLQAQPPTPGGDVAVILKVKLARDPNRPTDELFDFLALAVKHAQITYCIHQGKDYRQHQRFFIAIPAQANRMISVVRVVNGVKQAFISLMSFRGRDIERALTELSSGDTDDVGPPDIEVHTRFFSFDVQDEDEMWGAGRKRKRAEIVYSEHGFCGPQALTLGLSQSKKTQLQDYMKAAGKPRLLNAARKLYHDMGFLEEETEDKSQRGPMDIEDFQAFVDLHKAYRVVIWPKIAGVINPDRHIIFEGEQYHRELVNAPEDTRTSEDNYTIHILYIEEDHHFEYLHKPDLLGELVKTRGTDGQAKYHRFCDYCIKVFPYNARKDIQAWREHNCLERDLCKACGEFYADLDRHLKDATPCPRGCGLLISLEIHHGTKTVTNEETGEKTKEPTQSRTCLKRHLQSCRENVDCDQCGKKHFPDVPCGSHMCRGCWKLVTREMVTEHRCYVSHEGKSVQLGEPDTFGDPSHTQSKDLSWAKNYYVWDTECLMRKFPPKAPFTYNKLTLERGEIMEHIPIICGVMNIASGQQTVWTVWDGVNPMIELLKFIIEQSKGTILLSHYGSRYDMQLLYNAGVSLYGAQVVDMSRGKFVMEGCTIKQAKIKNVVLRDTFLHLKSSLDKLPSMLGITDEHFRNKYGAAPKKLYFPYPFCTDNTLEYEGPIPALDFYQPERKHPKERKELEKWHAQQKTQGVTWNLKDEYLKYFPMDLNLLAEAVIAYTGFCIDHGFGLPFEHATLPGLAYAVLRKHLPSYSMPVLRSFPSFEKPWEYTEFNEWKLCNDAYRGGLTGNYWIYGKADLEKGEQLCGLDYNSHYPGCMFNTAMPSGDYKFHMFCPETQPKFEDLEHLGGVIVCEIEPTRAVAHPPLHRVIDGRLNFHLLPCLTKTEAAHAHIHCFNKQPNTLCQPECPTCTKYWSQPPQPYTFLEVIHAVKKYDYKLRYVYCMLHTSVMRDDIFKSFISATYGNKVKFSDPPSLDWGDPKVCMDYVEELYRHAGIEIPREFHTHPQDWHTPNKSMKDMSKLVPNSGYGRTGMSPFKGTVDIVGADYKEELEYERKHGHELDGQPIYHAGHTLYKRKALKPNSTIGNTNVLIAAYITASARMKIVDDMNLAVSQGCKVIYGDTDSMFFIKPAHAAGPPTGIFLGQLENDFKASHGTPCEIVALLPKTYAIRNTEGRVIKMRFKGVSGVSGSGGDARNCALITWEWMKFASEAMVLGEEAEPVIVHHRQVGWKRNKLEPNIEWQDSFKVARANLGMLKGRLAKSGRIYPLGAENFDWGEEIEWVECPQ